MEVSAFDKEIKRMKADDIRLVNILKTLGYTAYFGYNPSDQDDIFTVTCMVELPDNKIFVDLRMLVTRVFYNSLYDSTDNKALLAQQVANGELIIVDVDPVDLVKKAWKEEQIKEFNRTHRWVRVNENK